jgi:hypothetical protein
VGGPGGGGGGGGGGSVAASGGATATATATDSATSPSASLDAGDAALRLRPVAVLLPPDRRLLPRGLPSQHFGSDHLCLVSVFELTRDGGGPCPVAYASTDSATVAAAQ